MTLLALFYCPLAVLISSSLHTEFHKREWPTCISCSSHSYSVPIILGIYSLLLCLLVNLGIDNITTLGGRVLFIYLIIIPLGLWPVLPLNHWGVRPFPQSLGYLISSWSLFLFVLASLGITATAFTIQQVMIFNTDLTGKLADQALTVLGVALGVLALGVGPITYFFISPPPQNQAGKTPHLMFLHGKGYLLTSIIIIFIGLILLIFIPLVTWASN